MASRLLVTPEEVSAKALEISNQKEAMEELMKDMNKKVDSLVQEAWIGEAGSAYQQQFQFVTQEVRDALTRIETHVRNLNDAAKAYDQLENETKSQVSALDTSNIF